MRPLVFNVRYIVIIITITLPGQNNTQTLIYKDKKYSIILTTLHQFSTIFQYIPEEE
jgi:hypothetical protein